MSPKPENTPSEQVFPMRLQKFLARAGVASRRGSEDLMTAGRVSVNGEIRTELGTKVDPNVDVICVDGKEVRLSDGCTYLILHKPEGVVTTMSDPQGRPCVASLVPRDKYPGLYPVGRLDRDTTGLLMFTTDGDMGQALLHPKHHVIKTYRAVVDGFATDADFEPLRRGMTLDDGPCKPAKVTLDQTGPKSRVTVTISEGRKRQVKRMLGAVHHPVLHLHRDVFGPIELGDLPRGQWRLLTDDEVRALKELTGL